MITPGLLPESYLWLTALLGRRRLRSTSTRPWQPGPNQAPSFSERLSQVTRAALASDCGEACQ